MSTIGIVEKKHAGHVFFRIMGIASLFVIIAGFARTYYLKAWTGAAAVGPLVHIHAVLFTTWILLFLVQTTLVANNRTDLHRKLGILGALLATAMITEGTVAAIASVRHGFMGQFPNEPSGFVDPIAFFALPVGDLLVFTSLIGSAFWFRYRAGVHKRLMVLATVSLLPPALARIPLGPARLPVAVLGFLCLLVAGPIYDWRRNRRIHPLFVWGTAFVFLSTAVRPLIGNSAAWHSFVRWLLNM